MWRPSTGVWYWLISSAGYSYSNQYGVDWGITDDIPIGTDYDNDGYADLAIWRPSESTWYILLSTTGYLYGVAFVQGVEGEQPLIGNFDQDGQQDTAFFAPSTGTWTVFNTSSGLSSTHAWGSAGDIPMIRR